MVDIKEQELLKALLRVLTIEKLMKFYIKAKTTGFEEEYTKMVDFLEESDKSMDLDYFYADRIIDVIFKNY